MGNGVVQAALAACTTPKLHSLECQRTNTLLAGQPIETNINFKLDLDKWGRIRRRFGGPSRVWIVAEEL